jgi:DNA-directed RNA polymerase subunit RPC12/RpoP
MSNRINRTPEISMIENRCYECGRYWAYDSYGSDNPRCPVCAGRQIDRLFKRQEELTRTINALKGALTKAKAKP